MTTVKFPSARVPDFIKSEHWLLNSQYYFALQQIFRPGDTTADSELQTLTRPIHETSHKNVQVQIGLMTQTTRTRARLTVFR